MTHSPILDAIYWPSSWFQLEDARAKGAGSSKIFNTVTGAPYGHTAIAPQHEHLISRKIK